ncbi:MAG TPA: hypothetical protein VFQ81_00335 [Candidatus Limnocylindria bacterium]|nr:hypothetical protein [Candidatus Limnocylindria bacterium]
MSRPPIVRDVVILSAIALLVRGLAAALVSWPAYTDPAYYTLVAERIATGHGFTVPVIWSFLEVGATLPADPVLPVASNGHWMPLTSLLPAAFMAIFGTAYGVAQVPMVLLSAALVPLTYLVGWRFWHSRTVAIGASILALFAGPLLIMYPQVANFAPFGVTGALAIGASCLAVSARRPGPLLVAAGLAAGLATLARVDGLLLTIAPATAWLLRWRPRDGEPAWRPRPALAWGVASAAAYLAVIGPWLVRNLGTFGSPFPSAGGHTLWITDYNEQFSIGHPVTLDGYLAAGPGLIMGSKIGALIELIGRTGVLLGGIFLVFFAYGLLRAWRRPELVPFVATFGAVFAAMVLIFTFHAPHGAFYHGAPAWLPFAMPIAVAAVPDACVAASRWWRFLGRPATHRFVLVAGLAGAGILSVVGSLAIYGGWVDDRRIDTAAGSFFVDAGDTASVVMSDDPSALWHASGNPGVPLPFDPYPVVEQVIRAYDVEWVVLSRRGGAEADPLGLWEGAEAVDAAGNRASFLAADPAFEAPGVRIYRVAGTGD